MGAQRHSPGFAGAIGMGLYLTADVTVEKKTGDRIDEDLWILVEELVAPIPSYFLDPELSTDGRYAVVTRLNAVYLLNASTGKILATVITGSTDFAQSVFAGGWLFTANGNGVYAWAP